VRKKHRIHTIWIQMRFRHERGISCDSSTDSELQRSEKGHNAVFHRLWNFDRVQHHKLIQIRHMLHSKPMLEPNGWSQSW